jgi:hypothetical protein
MTGPRSHGLPSPTVCAAIVIAMLAMIAIPAGITLHTVHHPAPLIPLNQKLPWLSPTTGGTSSIVR